MDTTVMLGRAVPDFELPATGGEAISLAGLKGRNIVIYFYPKDNTPGCTLEGQDFRDQHAEFAKFNTVILGVSRDTLSSHEKFRKEQNFSFDLLSDSDEVLSKLFDVIKLKNMYGKEVMGIERSTFVIDKQGVLRKEWRKVKVEGHVAEVLEAIKAL